MNILFYVDPWIELNNPVFRYPVLRDILSKVMRVLDGPEYNLELVCNEQVKKRALAEGVLPSRVDVVAPPLPELMKVAAHYHDFSLVFGQGRPPRDKIDAVAAHMLAGLRHKNPDVIFIWESAANFLPELFPDALVLWMTPGILSREPFPFTVSLDFDGIFGDSSFARADYLASRAVQPDDVEFYRRMRQFFFWDFLSQVTPFSRTELADAGRYEKLLLLPLQVSNYFAFTGTSNYRGQLDLLLDVMSRVPKDVAVVVTQYSFGVEDIPITPKNIVQLKDMYPNLVYSQNFDRINNISQFLLPLVDGVVSVSSAVALQAAMLDKPVWAAGRSHLNAVAQPGGLRNVGRFNSVVPVESTRRMAAYFTYSSLDPINTLYSGEWLRPRLERAVAVKRGERQGGVPLEELFAAREAEYRTDYLYAHSRRDATCEALAPMQENGKRRMARRDNRELVAELKLLNRSSFKVISFDVFDTLIQRSLASPADVFRIMEREVRRISDGRLSNFLQCRTSFERLAMQRAAAAGRGEVTLKEIYSQFVEHGILSASCADEIMHLEIDTEKRVLTVREQGLRLFNIARASGKRVILVSDMYLSRDTMRDLLGGLGIVGYDEIYVSSEYGEKKHTGKLFDVVCEREKVLPAEILHIGDNPAGDLAVPREKGIRPHLIQSAVVRYKEMANNKKVYENFWRDNTLWSSIHTGMVATRFYADTADAIDGDSQFNGNPFHLGYAGMGPILAGFSLWLAARAKMDGTRRLFFLSRDGYILKSAFDVVAKHYCPDIASHYLYASRHITQRAKLDSDADIIRTCHTNFSSGTLGTFLKVKFNLSEDEIGKDLLSRYNYSLQKTMVNQDNRCAFIPFCLELKTRIAERSRETRDLYTEYLRGNDFYAPERKAIVDIGYAGTMQDMLSAISGDASLGGYYMITYDTAGGVKTPHNIVESYFEEFGGINSWQFSIPRLTICLETIFTNCEGCCVDIRRNASGEVEFVYGNNEMTPEKHEVLPLVHRGAIAFVSDLMRHFSPWLQDIIPNPYLATEPYVKFITAPAARDANLFNGFIFEDTYGGVGTRYVIRPEARQAEQTGNPVGWAAGQRALTTVDDNNVVTGATSRPMQRYPKLKKALYAIATKVLDQKRYEKLRDRIFYR